METFLPQVIQSERDVGNEWREAPSRTHMEDILELFGATSTNEQKNRRTNELLRAFALCFQGQKLGNKFTEQRRWLTEVYEKEITSIDEKRELARKLARTATFLRRGWYLEDSRLPNCISGLEEDEEGALGSFLVRYLRDANSRLSVPILARFYCQLLDGQSTAADFIECAKACAAFFTLWRSSNSTSGLDEVYRRYFRGSPLAKGCSWRERPDALDVGQLKSYFAVALEEKEIASRQGWLRRSARFLLYSELRTICRFALFVAAHDRIPDSTRPGLTACRDKGVVPPCLLSIGGWGRTAGRSSTSLHRPHQKSIRGVVRFTRTIRFISPETCCFYRWMSTRLRTTKAGGRSTFIIVTSANETRVSWRSWRRRRKLAGFRSARERSKCSRRCNTYAR